MGKDERGMVDSREGLCFGLVGGLGVGASIHYYQELARAHAERGSVMQLVMIHADVNRVLRHAAAGETDLLADYLSGLIGRMADAGAQIAAIPAVTPHICEPRLRDTSALPLVSLVEEILQEVRRRGMERVALFGTRFVIESGLFGRLNDVDVIAPWPGELEEIHAAYLATVTAGMGTTAVRETLGRIAHRLCEQEGAEAIVLAGTELSLVFEAENTDFPCIDGAQLHLDALMRRIFGESA
jgi:aspartate racemase